MLLLPQLKIKYKAKTSLKSMGNVPQRYLGKSLPIRFNKKAQFSAYLENWAFVITSAVLSK
jgi:hypothetical protein